ncbi:hypothetical protein [Prosthecobacter sp.]|uniref:hypothetical protein n=1 Tax=Prosthecobacter sp. TaxID=1965333 RepID=UPI002486F3A1|nr:hypothetical protein [Prosthecobacter sp.]MDI1313461.1 hypothetical protein [Prosthecobacter sp.]
MKNRERFIVSSIFAVLMFGWLGFLLHVSSDFAGSGLGAVFGISGAVLMLVPLVYVFMKRIPFFKEHFIKYVSLQTWLTIHIYTGIVGALLALIHTGHKYNSPLGIALTATMLLVVVTGYVLRYLTPFVNLDMKDKLLLLQTARGDLDSAWGVLEKSAAEKKGLPKAPLLTAGLDSLGLSFASDSPAGQVTTLAVGVADLEYSIRTHELLKRWFARALTAHIVLSVAMYALLAAHIAAGIYFGLRWLP